MKKYLAIPVLFMLFISAHVSAQKILMKISGVTSAGGEEVRALDFKTDAESSWLKGGGVSIAKPIPTSFTIKKTNGKSSNAIYKKMLTGSSFPEVIFEYYDATNTLYFKFTLTDCYLTQFYWLSPECPTCIKLEHEIGFVFKTIEANDIINASTLKWDVPTGVAQ